MKAHITKKLLSTIIPKEKQFDVWDTAFTGFILRVHPNGKKVYRYEYARGKRFTIGDTSKITLVKARQRAKDISLQYHSGVDPKTNKSLANAKANIPTLKHFINHEYKDWRIANRRWAEEDIQRIGVHFFPVCGNISLDEISPRTIETWRTKRLREGKKHDTVNREVILLKAVLSKAVEWEIIKENPLEKLTSTKGPDSSRIRYLSPTEETSLLEAFKQREQKAREARLRHNIWLKSRKQKPFPVLKKNEYSDYLKPMVILSLHTGLRQGELFNLSWSNINLEKKHISILGKNNKWRHIPLNSTAHGTLSQWRKQIKSEALVFPNKNNQPFDNVNKAWNTLLTNANIENFRWHDMRHHFASKLVMAGVDLNTVRELLGHADIKMTLRYAHLAPEHKAQAVSKIG